MTDLVAIDPESVSPDLVETIEAVLEKARAGEVSSVAIAFVYRDGSTHQTWSSPPSFFTLLGAVHQMAFRMSYKKERPDET